MLLARLGSFGGLSLIKSGNKPLQGIGGMYNVFDESRDDHTSSIGTLFNFKFYGLTYSTLYVCSNNYVITGNANDYSNLALGPVAVPDESGLHLGSADNSYQRLYTQYENGEWVRIRYEGTASTSGTPGSPNIVWEMYFPKPSSNQQLIEIVFGVHARSTGNFGVTNGATSNASFVSGGNITENSSYVFESDGNGENWIIHPNSYLV